MPVERLRARWLDATPVVYLGKADVLRDRIRALVRFGAEAPTGHWGGRLIWQLAASEKLLIAWREHPAPRQLEVELLSDFQSHFGALPFANLIR